MTQWQPQGRDPRQQPPQWGQPQYPQQPQYARQQLQPYGQQYPPQQQWGQPQVAPKSPALGLIVSVFLPGVGSMMAGKAGKGIGILAGYMIGWLLCLVLIGFVVMPVFWTWGLVAAYRDAVGWNRDRGIIS